MDSEYILIAIAIIWLVSKLIPKKQPPAPKPYADALRREQHTYIDYEAEKTPDQIDIY